MDETREYLLEGLGPLVPIPLGSKGPRTAGWNRRENCVARLADAAKLDGQNVGLAHLYARTCAVDIDDAECAIPWLEALGIDAKALGKAPDAVQILSGRQGRGKLLYALPSGIPWLPTLKPVGSGLELRCATKDGATTVQDVLPPSIHPETGKPYVWGGSGSWRDLPVLPASLLRIWQSEAVTPARPSTAQDDSEAADVVEGGRNDHLTKRAGVMRRSSFDAEAIAAALLVENETHCAPPLARSEVLQIARSVARYEPAASEVVNAEMEITRLSALPHIGYEVERRSVAERLGIRASALDALVKTQRGAQSDETDSAAAFGIYVPTTWPDPVNGAAVLMELHALFDRYLMLPAHAAAACALWVAWTYVFDTRDTAPILFATSPAPACGKSTLMTLIERTASRPLVASNTTVSSIFRLIEAVRPTLLIDEGDSFMAGNDELRGILNSGHARQGARVVRVEGDAANRQPVMFSTWAPKMIAAIGRLPDTIESRSIVVRMQRKPPGAQIPRLGRARFSDLCSKLARFAADAAPAIETYDFGEPPDWLGDRAFDSWEPLFAVAASAGGDWPAQALAAAAALCGHGAADATTVGSDGIALLKDIKSALRDDEDRIPSDDLAQRLGSDETLPWIEHTQGKRITPRQVAALLRPFGIAPATIRMPGRGTQKGYHRGQFADAWERYLTPQG